MTKGDDAPRSIQELFANNDVELFDVENDPNESNLAADRRTNGDPLVAMNEKLKALIESEVGEDRGRMLSGGNDASWTLDQASADCERRHTRSAVRSCCDPPSGQPRLAERPT